MKKKSSKQKKKQEWSKAKQTKRMMFCWDCMARYSLVLWSVKDRCQSNKKAFNEKTKLTKKELDMVLAADLMIKHSDLFNDSEKDYLEVGICWEDEHGDIEPSADTVFSLFKTIEVMAMMATTSP